MTKQKSTFISTLTLVCAASAFAACGDDSTADPIAETGGDAGGTVVSDAGAGGTDAGSSTTSKDAGGSTAVSTADKSIVDIVVGNDDFSTLESAVITAELAEALSGPGPFTVFAPTNAAFSAALAELGLSAKDLTKALLTPILTYHVVDGKVGSKDLKTGPVKMLSGLSSWVNLEGGAKVNEAKVTTADIVAKNGVIHVVDKVILPPDIVQFATYAGFSSLTGAVTSAGLVDTLKGKGANDAGYTVFAPTNAAFAALPAVPTGDALKNVLLYHVVPGTVLSTALVAGSVPTALAGKSLTVKLTGGVTVNDAKVGPADLVVSNGVIHVIDKVLVPAL